jgi:hypothetical protein
MGQCEYGRGEEKVVEYYDYEKKAVIKYECPRSTLPYKDHCEFHDKEYAENNPDDVMKLFYGLVDDAIQNAKQLDCICFIFQGKLISQKNLRVQFIFPMLPSLKKHTSLTLPSLN